MTKTQPKLTQKQAESWIPHLESFLEKHPRRIVIMTEYGPIRRLHVREDVMKHTEEVNNGRT